MAIVFSLSSLLVLPFWAAMIVFPLWSVTRRVLASPWVAAAPAVLYAALVLPRSVEILTAVSNPSLADIAALLGTEFGATVAWVHFLAFDLCVGRWVYLDSRERGIHPFMMAPVLLLTFMLGPLGFLVYLGVRAVVGLRPAAHAVAVSASSHA